MSPATHHSPLCGQHVLVTRPHEQNLILADKLHQLGAVPINLPAIEIVPIDLQAELINKPLDIVIFVSINAVRYGMLETTEISNLFSTHTQIAAIGAASYEQLNNAGVSDVLVPSEQFDSEGLLALEDFQHLKNKNILIVKGIGGRTHLFDELVRRGARVETIDVYQRQRPTHINQSALPETLHVSLFSSSESVDNILSITPESFHSALLNSQVIAGHQRIAAKVTSLGFNKLPIIAANPTDAAMIAALLDWTNTTEIKDER